MINYQQPYIVNLTSTQNRTKTYTIIDYHGMHWITGCVKIYSCTEKQGIWLPTAFKKNSTHTQLNPAGAKSSFRKVNLPHVK